MAIPVAASEVLKILLPQVILLDLVVTIATPRSICLVVLVAVNIIGHSALCSMWQVSTWLKCFFCYRTRAAVLLRFRRNLVDIMIYGIILSSI